MADIPIDARVEVNSDLPYPYWFSINVCDTYGKAE